MPAPADARKGGRAELGVALLLAGLGIFAIVDVTSVEDPNARGFLNARTVPCAVGGLLVLTGVLLAIDVLRGGRGEQEEGEDIDLSQGTDWKTIGLLVAGFAANALLIDTAGWPISGAILFFISAFALGARHYVRLAIISIVLSVGSWYLFFYGLDIRLPVGPLKGIL